MFVSINQMCSKVAQLYAKYTSFVLQHIFCLTNQLLR